MSPMSPHTLGSLGMGKMGQGSYHRQSSGNAATVNFPATDNGSNQLSGTTYDRGAFYAARKVKNMMVAQISPDARDSGFSISPHTGKN